MVLSARFDDTAAIIPPGRCCCGAEWQLMVIVVRVGPLPLGRRRTTRVRELERIFATAVELVEVFDAVMLVAALELHSVGAIALDASGPENLAAVVAAAGPRPILRPLWRSERNSRGEIDELFDGYGRLTAGGTERLADGQLSTA